MNQWLLNKSEKSITRTRQRSNPYVWRFIENPFKYDLYSILENTREILKNERYFSHHAFDNNCQQYIRSILQENGWYNQAIDNFLFQDISKLKNELPCYVPNIANAITTVGAVVSDAMNWGYCFCDKYT